MAAVGDVHGGNGREAVALMIDAFAELATSKDTDKRAAFANSSLRTQEYLDAIWAALTS